LQRKADLYAELAKELEEKLSKRNAEIMALRRSNQILQKECTTHKSKISTLETQCVARSAKVAQLSDTISARKKDKVQERLMEKSLEIADLVEENERLKIQKKHVQEENSRNGKLLLEMCEIVRLLSQIDISYERVLENDGENGGYSNIIYPKSRFSDNFLTPSGDLPQDIPMENVRRKIKAMEGAIRERGDLRKETELQKQKLSSLREQNADLNFEINSLEAKLRDHEDQSRGWDHSLQQRTMTEAPSKTWGNDSNDSSHSSHHSRNTFSTASYSDDSSKDVSLGDFVAENGRTHSEDPSEDTGINDSYRESDTRSQFLFSPLDRSLSTVDELNDDCEDEDSENTSFSSLEAPPSQAEEEEDDEQSENSSSAEQSVRPEEHKQLQNNFEKALDVIEKLKQDLSRSNNASSSSGTHGKRDFDDASTDVARLEHNLEEAVSRYTLLKGEHMALCDRHEEELEACRRIRDELEASHKEKLNSLEEASKLNIEELTKRNKHLELQYNDLEAEYTLKIESLEAKLKEMKQQNKERSDDSESKCENLEEELTKLRQEMKQVKKEYDAAESVQQERVDALLEEHTKNMAEESKKFEDLRYEYDTFLEIHLKLEEDAQQAKEHYKDSLLKIRNLESEAKASIAAAEKTKWDHQQAIEAMNGTHQEDFEKSKILNQKELKKMEATITEWKVKFNKLKRDHVSTVKAHNEATQQFVNEIKQIKKDHGMVMAKQGRMRQSDAAKYKKLRRDFDTALVDYGKKEAITIHTFEQSKREYESKIADYRKKINEFEKLLPLAEKNALTETFNVVDSESKEKLERLMETNENLSKNSARHEFELEKRKQCQEQVEADYRDLAASYQASLLKIESLIQQREGGTIEEITEVGKGGTVMERIKQLENKTKAKSSKLENEVEDSPSENNNEIPSPSKNGPEMTASQSGSDSGFQRDFDMIITKLGADSSNGESNLESSSVVSSVGSSAASSAIFDAIYKRVEEHAQKMETATKIESSVQENTAVYYCQSTDFYAFLHHFINLSVVNSSFKKLPQFQTLIEDETKLEESTVGLKDGEHVPETISNLLIHRKRFEGVQTSLLHQINMTQLDELYPSTLMGLFPSEYGNTEDSITPLDPEYSSPNTHPTRNLEEKSSYEDESSEAARLHEENFSKQLFRNTEQIRSKTREKEIRVLNLKYEKLREEFQQMTSNKVPRSQSSIGASLPNDADGGSPNTNSVAMTREIAPALNRTEQIESFRKRVLLAELKAECTKRLHFAQKEINHNPSSTNEIEDFEESTESVGDKNAFTGSQYDGDTDQIENDSGEFEELEEPSRNAVDEEQIATSFSEDEFTFETINESSTCTCDESEDCTSNGESRPVSTTSLDAQDGKPASFGSVTKGTKDTAEETEYTATSVEDGEDASSGESDNANDSESVNDDGSGSNNTNDTNPNQKVEAIQLELNQARKAAEAARRKQLEREQNLRDVIFQYKKLQKQHQEANTEKQQPRKWKNRRGPSTANLEKDLKQAHANVNAVKRELKVACEQHSEEKEHLRDVMGQFQNLQADFLRVLAEKQVLEKAVYERPGLQSGVVPASITTGPQPRFLNSSGSWVASTIGGPSFDGMTVESAKPANQRPSPDGAPMTRVVGPPQRLQYNPVPTMVVSNQYVSPNKVVELGDRDRVSPNRPIRSQPQAHSAQRPQRTQMPHSAQNSNHTRTTAYSIHSGISMRRKQPQQNFHHQQLHPQQRQQMMTRNKLQQQQLRQKQQIQDDVSTTKSVGKKKKRIFRGWKKQ